MNANVRDPTHKENAENIGMPSHAGARLAMWSTRCEGRDALVAPFGDVVSGPVS